MGTNESAPQPLPPPGVQPSEYDPDKYYNGEWVQSSGPVERGDIEDALEASGDWVVFGRHAQNEYTGEEVEY